MDYRLSLGLHHEKRSKRKNDGKNKYRHPVTRNKLTLGHHKTYWKVQKQHRKEKEIADKELIKELVGTEEDRIIKKKK